jgi:hypothetical protein
MDVELLLQDNDWQTIHRYKPNENGVISFVTESKYINYTLVAKDQKGDAPEGLNVVSFYQASSATPAHYQAEFDNVLNRLNEESCECITQNLALEHSPIKIERAVTHSSKIDDWAAIDDSNTLFKGVQVCRIKNEDWPLHSFSVAGLDSSQDLIAVGQFLDLNVGVSDEGVWPLSAILAAKNYGLDYPYQQTKTVQLIDGDKHFATEVVKDEEEILLFSGHKYISQAYYQSQASVTFVLSDGLFKSAVSKNIHQVISTSAEESLALMAGQYQPAFKYPNFDEIKSDGRYDYSAVSGYPMAIINFTLAVSDPITGLPMPVQWTFFGPEKGVLAISVPLTGYEDIINIDSDIKVTNVHLVKSKEANNYQDYIDYYQSDKVLDVTNDFIKNMTAAELVLQL